MLKAQTLTGESIRLVLVAVALTIVIATPVVLEPGARLFGTELVGYHPDPYIVIGQFEGAPRLDHFTQPATDWVGVVLAKIFGGVIAYNLLILATFPLAALFAYLLARRLGLSAWPSALVGLSFAFSPFHLAHAAYHPHVAQVQWLPAYLLALWLCIERWSAPRAALLILAGALLALSNFYAALMGVVLTPVALAALWLGRHRGDLRGGMPQLLRTAATLATAAVLGGLYVYRVAGDAVLGERRFAFPYEDLFRYCARWWSYFVPAVEHPFLGDWARGVWEHHGIAGVLVEQQVSLSLGMSALALVAMVAWARSGGWRSAMGRVERDRMGVLALVPALTAIALVAFLFSLPPEGRPSFLPRPSALVHSLLPMFRAHARFGLAVQLMVFLLAATGVSSIMRSKKRSIQSVGVLLVLLALFELAPLPPWRWRWVLPTQAHRWAESQSQPMKILDCARPRPGESFRLARMRHPTRLPGGRVSDCGEPGLGGKLAALGYTHLLVRAGYPLDSAVPVEGFESGEEFSDSRILVVTAPRAVVYTGAIRGFSWREVEGRSTFRWLGREGVWEVVSSETKPTKVMLEIEISAFLRPRHLTILFNGESAGELEVTTTPTTHRIGPLAIRPGRNGLRFIPTGEPVVPDRILHNGDQREITIGVWSWAWRAR